MIYKTTYYFAISVALLAVVYYFSPESKQEDVKRLARYITNPEVNSCMKEWKNKFEDPDSLIYLSSFEKKEGDLRQLKIEYKAKNIFGAYVSNYLTCGLDADGKLNFSETLKYRYDPYYGMGIDVAVPAADLTTEN